MAEGPHHLAQLRSLFPLEPYDKTNDPRIDGVSDFAFEPAPQTFVLGDTKAARYLR